MTDFNLITDALAALRDEDINSATIFLQQFVVLNTPEVRRNPLKIYDWVSTDGCRPVMIGVFHDEDKKMAVASNTHVLIASKPDYREDCAGKIIKRDGDEQSGNYPQWQRVFPECLDGWVQFDIDRNRIKELLKQIKFERRIDRDSSYKAIRIAAGVFIKPDDCKYLLQLPVDGKFYFRDTQRPITYYSDDSKYQALIFPTNVDDNLNDMELIPA